LYKLVCDGDTKLLGIENQDGSWNYEEFRKHVKECTACKAFAKSLQNTIKKTLTTKKEG